MTSEAFLHELAFMRIQEKHSSERTRAHTDPYTHTLTNAHTQTHAHTAIHTHTQIMTHTHTHKQ